MDKEEITIEVGMEATVYIGSDCYPYIVVEIRRGGLQVVLRELSAQSAADSDFYNNQKWIIKDDGRGELITANKKRKNGHYYHDRIFPVSFGKARMHQNPSF